MTTNEIRTGHIVTLVHPVNGRPMKGAVKVGAGHVWVAPYYTDGPIPGQRGADYRCKVSEAPEFLTIVGEVVTRRRPEVVALDIEIQEAHDRVCNCNL